MGNESIEEVNKDRTGKDVVAVSIVEYFKMTPFDGGVNFTKISHIEQILSF